MVNNIGSKKSDNKFSAAISLIKQQVQEQVNVVGSVDVGKFPDIIDFIYNKKYLDMASDSFELTDMQKIIMTCFYRGQRGNEKLKLSKDEIKILQVQKMDQVLDKYLTNTLFNQLVLVLGRRCISEDTLIFDAETGEQKTVKEWHDLFGKLEVWTYNENRQQFEKYNAETIYQGERECFRVTVDNGDYVDCTDNHPLLTPTGWKHVSELKPGNEIAQSDTNLLKTARQLRFTKIRSIASVGLRQTYDLSVDSTENCVHNFVISNGLQMKNSGKDLITSIVALYEIMKLLEIPGGDPFSYYGIAKGNPIYILTVANSQDQAKILYTDIKEKLQRSPYFRDKIGFIEADRIYLLTPSDKKFNHQMEEEGLSDAKTKGSVVIMCGHSNSEGLLGKRIFGLLLDEVASFKKSSADTGDMYSRLGPSTADFRSPTQVDSNGEAIMDSKIISISSPRGQEGILWFLYKTAKETPTRLVFKLPTWDVRPKMTRDMLRREYSYMNESEFMMEFGAEFSGTAGEKFIPDHYVDEAVELGIQVKAHQRMFGNKGVAYYAHLDPAISSHNYALVVLHVEDRIRGIQKENGVVQKEKFKFFVVDHIKVWTPGLNDSVNINEVDEYILQLSKYFRFVSVSYDSFESGSSMQKLRKAGIPTKKTPFRRSYTVTIYDMLEHLLVNHQLALQCKGPHAELLQLELKGLKRKYGPNGYRVVPDTEGTIKTDDCADCVAGAIGVASDAAYQGYVRSGTVYMPQSHGMGQSWNIGGASYIDEQLATLRKFGKL